MLSDIQARKAKPQDKPYKKAAKALNAERAANCFEALTKAPELLIMLKRIVERGLLET
jgi:hypothetical protein